MTNKVLVETRVRQHSRHECSHESCLRPRLNGRDYCLDHELEYEDRVESLIGGFGVTRPKQSDEETVYFIGLRGDDSAVKIGKTNGDVHKRRNELQTSHYRTLIVLADINLPKNAERVIHKALKPYRLKGEWFQRNVYVERLIEAAKKRCPIRFAKVFNELPPQPS